MVDLTKIPFGTKLVNKITGEVGVYNSMFTEPSYIIRVGDKQYQGTNNSPLIQEWEIYEKEDNWNIHKEISDLSFDKELHHASVNKKLFLLKEKISEDIRKIDANSTKDWDSNDFIRILDKRFGF